MSLSLIRPRRRARHHAMLGGVLAAGALAGTAAVAPDAQAFTLNKADAQFVLDQILERFGNRGYRAVQLEAGILGGKVYLLSYALGLGATGLTFYDDDVVRFFSPHASGKSVMFLMAVGHSAASGRPLRSARP